MEADTNPRIRPDELVIVLKPRLNVDLRAAFGPGGISTAVQGLTGSTANAGVSVWPVWDQNIVVVGVKTEALASKLIGDVTLTIGYRQIPFHGHLNRLDKPAKASSPLQTPKPRNPFGTSSNGSTAKSLRYYKKTVPACYRCGTLATQRMRAPTRTISGVFLWCECEHHPVRPNEAQLPTQLPHLRRKPLHWLCGCVGKFRKAWKPTPPQLKHGQPGHHKQGGPAPPENGVKKPQNSKQRKTGQPKPSNVQAGSRSKPPTFQAGDFPPLVSPQQKVSSWAGVASQPPATTPSEIEISKQLEIMQKRIATLERENQALKAMQAPQRTEPESMQASASSDEEQESGSDLSGYTSVSKTETVVTNSEGIETLQAAIQDLKQSLVPILTASILQTIQNWLTPQLEEIKASTKMPEQRRRKIVHRNPANSESEGTMEQPIAHQIETSMPTQAPTQAPVVMMPPPQQ
ncbi:hypothetical protein HPB49_020733 [Dermacentor silvarum]|uniref:Uncharacterized protein n=1 Tax=Dermacentor silvarum TaxID=543639 RepID=A0ACB8CMU5_DERSI|nr:hypothetical protein HPB49_020733 [Dermacentor silvarum]